MGNTTEYNSKKTYLKRLLGLATIFILLQILFFYYISQTQKQLDDLNQLDNNCNLKQSIITVLKKTVANVDATHDFAECSLIDPSNPTFTSDMLKSQQDKCKNNLLIYNSLNWVVGVINTMGLGLLSAIILIPSNEALFSV